MVYSNLNQHVPPGTQEISMKFTLKNLLCKLVRNFSSPKGWRGVRGNQVGTFHREPSKIIIGFHQEILLREKVRNQNTPKGREGVSGIEASQHKVLLSLYTPKPGSLNGASPPLNHATIPAPQFIICTASHD
jgi:hypothetical protein